MINLGSVSAGDAVSALNSLLQVYALSSGKTPMRSDKNIAEWKKYSKEVMSDLGEAKNFTKIIKLMLSNLSLTSTIYQVRGLGWR